MPFGLLYRFSDLLSWLFYYVIKYRRAVIETNLRNAFPEKNDDEINKIIKGVYRHLSDFTLETFKGFSTSKEKIVERCKVTNPEVLNAYFEKNQSVVLLGSHYTNYEWATRMGLQFKHKILGIYKPLKNPLIDKYLINMRSWNSVVAPLKETYKAIPKHNHTPIAVVLIADQSPSNLDNAFWFPFLNQDTVFLSGPDGVSRTFDYPVFYADEQCVSRGHYTITFSLLCDKPQEVEKGEVVRLYKNKLEEIIRNDPSYWLWSHKRWKHKRQLSNI